MVNYRRARVPGATYFFTVTLRDRRSDLLTTRAGLLRAVFRTMRRQRPFAVDAIVVLPDHIDTIWTLPPDDAYYSGRWRASRPGSAARWRVTEFPSPAAGVANTISVSRASGGI